MAFTKQAPEWNATGVEAPQSLKDGGWKAGVKPAADYFNNLHYKTHEAIKELQEKAGEVKTVNGQLPDTNGNVNVNVDTSGFVTTQTFDEHKTDYVSHPGTGTTTNTGNAYAVTLSPAPTSYVDKMGLILTINADSTGATTIDVNKLGAKAIKKANGSSVTTLKASGVYTLRYNATTGNFILQGEGGELSDADTASIITNVNALVQM